MTAMLIMMMSPIKNGRDKPPLEVTFGSLRSSRVTSKDDNKGNNVAEDDGQ